MSAPTYSPPVRRLIRDKSTRDFQFEVPDTKDKHGKNLVIDIEYWIGGAEPSTGYKGGIIIETATIQGHDVMGVIEDILPDIEEAILAKG